MMKVLPETAPSEMRGRIAESGENNANINNDWVCQRVNIKGYQGYSDDLQQSVRGQRVLRLTRNLRTRAVLRRRGQYLVRARV